MPLWIRRLLALARQETPDSRPKERAVGFLWRINVGAFEDHCKSARRKKSTAFPCSAPKRPCRMLGRSQRSFDQEYNTYAARGITISSLRLLIFFFFCSARPRRSVLIRAVRAAFQPSMATTPAPFEWHSRQLLDLVDGTGQWF